MATDFKRLIVLLQEELVEFIVIGGVAMVAQARPMQHLTWTCAIDGLRTTSNDCAGR
jgi:hypothetical protein